MAIPTIHGNTSLLALVRGVGFAFQPTGENLPRVDATASASSDTLTFASASPPLANGDRVRILPFAGQTLPAPLNEESTYFLRDFTATTAKLAATSGGATINLTSNGGYFRLLRADTWSADGLPEGLEIDPATGLLSGSATLPGVYNVTLRARNASGQSTNHLIVIGVEPNRYLQDASIEIDINLRDGRVRLAGPPVPNAATPSTEPEPVLHVKSGDRIVLSIGFMKDETLVELPLDQIRFGLKEFEPERLHLLNDGSYTQVGEFEEARYQIVAEFTTSAMTSILSGYEGDVDTFFDAVAEIEFITLYEQGGQVLDLRRTTRSFLVRVHRDLIVPNV
jgi:hypothetical protein